MSNDPSDVLDALERAQDAFEGVGYGIPEVEEGIAEGGGWETQLTKACKLLEVVDVLCEDSCSRGQVEVPWSLRRV